MDWSRELKNLVSGGAFSSEKWTASIKFSELKATPLIVYGLGECSHWFDAIGMKKYGLRPSVAVDKRPKCNEWAGVPVISSVKLFRDRRHYFNHAVVICVGDRNLSEQIKNRLCEVGFKKIFHISQFVEFHFPLLTYPIPKFCPDKNTLKKISSVLELLEDELSKGIYLRFLQIGLNQMPCLIPCEKNIFQYFPLDIELNKGYSNYFCCGSYDGENIRKMLFHSKEIEHMSCFEPEPENFKRLEKYAASTNRKYGSRIHCLQSAVANFTGKFRFTTRGGMGSRLAEDGQLVVEVTRLDDLPIHDGPTFISMDIEGQELNALTGGSATLKRYKPDLAICVYHQPTQIWEIPCFLKNLDLGYKFYLRNYTGFATETVLYATAG